MSAQTTIRRIQNRLIRLRYGLRGGTPIPEVPNDLFVAQLSSYGFAARYVAGRSVVELGCRTGYGTDFLSRAGASQILGVDPDPRSIAYARRRFGRPAVDFQVSGSVPPPSATRADVLVSINYVHTRNDFERILSDASALLSSGGTFILGVPPAVAPWGQSSHQIADAEWRRVITARFEKVEGFTHHVHAALDLASPFPSKVRVESFDFHPWTGGDLQNGPPISVFYVATRHRANPA